MILVWCQCLFTRRKIVPGQNNHVAIDLITTHMRKKLDERSVTFRESMAKAQMNFWKQRMTPGVESRPESLTPSGKSVYVLPEGPQLKVCRNVHWDHVRCKETSHLLREYTLSFVTPRPASLTLFFTPIAYLP